jgi:hypothetical protein
MVGRILFVEWILVVLPFVAAAIFYAWRRRRPHALEVRAGMDYEQLLREYRHSCNPYLLCALVGRVAPPEDEERYRTARHAFVVFMRGLEGRRFAGVAKHLDRESKSFGGSAPFDYVCDFLAEECERIRADANEVDGHGIRFSIGFIPKQPLYRPYRPAKHVPPASSSGSSSFIGVQR